MNFKRTKEDHDEKYFLFSFEGEVENLIPAGTLEKILRRGETRGKPKSMADFWQTSREGQSLRETSLVTDILVTAKVISLPGDLIL